MILEALLALERLNSTNLLFKKIDRVRRDNSISRKRRRHWVRQLRRSLPYDQVAADTYESVSTLAIGALGFFMAGRMIRKLI